MELSSRKKRNKVQVEKTKYVPDMEKNENFESYTKSIAIQCNTILYNQIQNMIDASHTANDFTYSSVADVIRAALEAYRTGMQLTEIDEKGKKTQTTVRVTEEQYQFYKKLPNRMKRKILEKVIRTFLKAM